MSRIARPLTNPPQYNIVTLLGRILRLLNPDPMRHLLLEHRTRRLFKKSPVGRFFGQTLDPLCEPEPASRFGGRREPRQSIVLDRKWRS